MPSSYSHAIVTEVSLVCSAKLGDEKNDGNSTASDSEPLLATPSPLSQRSTGAQLPRAPGGILAGNAEGDALEVIGEARKASDRRMFKFTMLYLVGLPTATAIVTSFFRGCSEPEHLMFWTLAELMTGGPLIVL